MKETETGSHSDTSMPEQYQKPNGYQAKESASSGAHTSHFLPTSRRIVQFSNGKVLLGCLLMFPFIFLSSFLSGFDWLSWNTSRFTCWKTVNRVHFQLKKYMGERALSLWLVLSSSFGEINAKKGENMGGQENVPYEIKHPDIFSFCIPELMYIWGEILIAKQAMGLILPSYLSFAVVFPLVQNSCRLLLFSYHCVGSLVLHDSHFVSFIWF